MKTCECCGEKWAVTDVGFCGQCYWKYVTEATIGFQQLRRYLKRQAEFKDWCLSHGRAA